MAVGAATLLGAFLLRGNSALPAETVLAPLCWLAVAAGAEMRCLLELHLGGSPARRTPLVEPVLHGAEPADAGRLGVARVPVPIDPPPAAPVEGLTWSPAEGPSAFGRANGLLLLDGADLLRRILACPRETQLRLLAVATEGDYQRPTCVRCGSKMTFRTQAGGTGFWGCERFPLCRHILHARSDEESTA